MTTAGLGAANTEKATWQICPLRLGLTLSGKNLSHFAFRSVKKIQYKDETKHFLKKRQHLTLERNIDIILALTHGFRLKEMLAEIIDEEEKNSLNVMEVEQPPPDIKR